LKIFQTSGERELGYCQPIDSISTSQFTLVVRKVEPEYWLAIVVTHENLFGDSSYTASETVSNMKKQSSMFKEEDCSMYQDLLNLFYDLSFMFNGSFAHQFSENAAFMEHVMLDFSKCFNHLYFKHDTCPSFFNNALYRGF
jgi:hypothetical protein